MQKKLITVAVAGALAAPGIAMAQSAAEVYGTVNMAFGQLQVLGRHGRAARWTAAPAGHAAGQRVEVGRVATARRTTAFALGRAWAAVSPRGCQIEQNAPLERSDNQAIKPASRNSARSVCEGGFGNVFLGQWTTPWADLDALWGIGTVGFWGPVTSIIGRRETTGTAPNYNCIEQATVRRRARSPAAGAPICDALQGGGGVGHAFWRRTLAGGVLPVAGDGGRAGQALPIRRTRARRPATPATNARSRQHVFGLGAVGRHGRPCAHRRGVRQAQGLHQPSAGPTPATPSRAAGTSAWSTSASRYEQIDVQVRHRSRFSGGPATTRATGCAATGRHQGRSSTRVALAVPDRPGLDPGVVLGRARTSSWRGRRRLPAYDRTLGHRREAVQHRLRAPLLEAHQYRRGLREDRQQDRTRNFTWTGAPPNQTQSAAGGPVSTPYSAPVIGITYFISMTHRF